MRKDQDTRMRSVGQNGTAYEVVWTGGGTEPYAAQLFIDGVAVDLRDDALRSLARARAIAQQSENRETDVSTPLAWSFA